MVSVWDVPQNVFVEYVAEELKQNDHIKPPVWAVYVKTGVHKERPPSANDWWYKRTASILKNIYKLGPVGVSKLRTTSRIRSFSSSWERDHGGKEYLVSCRQFGCETL